jgi:hypothetical protein
MKDVADGYNKAHICKRLWSPGIASEESLQRAWRPGSILRVVVPAPRLGIDCVGSLNGLQIHRKKSFSIYPSPAGMSLTKLFLGGNNDVIYTLFPPRESLVSDIPAGDGNIEKLFLQCTAQMNNGTVT